MKTSTANRPATGLRSANYTGFSSINGSNFLSNFSLRSSYQNYSSWYRQSDTAAARSSKSSRFDPLNQRSLMNMVSANNTIKDPLSSIISKERTTIYDKMKQLERNIHELVESSYVVASRGELKLALIKAQDAQSKMGALKKIFDKQMSIIERSSSTSPIENNLAEDRQDKEYTDTINDSALPVTTGVSINEGMIMVKANLLMQLLQNGQLNHAMEIYNELNNRSSLLDSKDSANDKVIARLGINIANEYYRQSQYQRALKYYRLTLDRISSSDYNNFRIKIMCNIGLTFIKSKQFSDAITSYQHIMTDSNSLQQRNIIDNIHHHQCGLHLILCQYIIKDGDSIKIAFQKLIETNVTNQFNDPMNPSNQSRPTDNMVYSTVQSLTNIKQTPIRSNILAHNDRYIELSSTQRVPIMANSSRTSTSSGSTVGGVRSVVLNPERLKDPTARKVSSPIDYHHNLRLVTPRFLSANETLFNSNNINDARPNLTSYSTTATVHSQSDPVSDISTDLTINKNREELNQTSLSLVRSAIKNDPLHKLIKAKLNQIQRSIVMAAKLLSRLNDFQPSSNLESNLNGNMDRKSFASSSSRRTTDNQISDNISRTSNTCKQYTNDGLQYCLELLQNSKYFSNLTSDLEISKATRFLDEQQFDQAIETLKTMESNQNPRSSSMAATNLSLLYLLKNEFALAHKYADHAILIDPFNANAYVNMGNSQYHQKNFELAEICYNKAIEADVNCLEAHYNLALMYRVCNQMNESLKLLSKLESTVKSFHPLMVQSVKM